MLYLDILRRAFTRWLTAKRSNELRRQAHQRKEAHLRMVTITSAWEKWRERFQEERLRPLVSFPSTEFTLSSANYCYRSTQSSLIIRKMSWLKRSRSGCREQMWRFVFIVLYCRTNFLFSFLIQSLPAVQFHSKHLKGKFFAKWKGALPNALRAKKARETDKVNTLGLWS